MDIKAFKMDGLGNDFVIIDNRQTITNLTKEQIIKICDRKFIGCDQLILIKKNDISDASLEFYNSCLLYTSPSPRDRISSRMPSSA